MAKANEKNINMENMEEEQPMTQEEMQQELLFNEADILKALKHESEHDHRTETIRVLFGRTQFEFRIRPLSEREWNKCRERNTKYSKSRRLGGMRLPENMDTPGYHSDLIYTATLDEDKAKLWDNKKFWDAVNAVTGVDMVDKMIPYAGKKQAVVDRIEYLSGYDEEAEKEYGEAVKN